MVQIRLIFKTYLREALNKLNPYGCLRNVIGFSIIYLLINSAIAQSGSIRNVGAFLIQDTLHASCHFKQGFMDEDMQQTLSSGMSTTFNFQFNLKYEQGSTIRSMVQEVAVRYDIWEKRYLLFLNNRMHQFPDYPAFIAFLSDSVTFSLGPVYGIDLKKSLRMIVFFSPEKISSAQKAKLKYWLNNNAEVEESAPGSEQQSGFSIDLSGLFSVFLSNEPKSKMQKYQSGLFTIESLRNSEKPAQ